MVDDKNYMLLYEAIWKQAVDDDFKEQKMRLVRETSEKIFPVLLKYSGEKRKSFTDILRIIKSSYVHKSEIDKLNEYQKELDKSFKLLIEAVQRKIYREAEKWPRRTRYRDKEYEAEYTEIKRNLIAKLTNLANVRAVNE
jgi:predicted DNA-binding ArsR family transcriptional regulator